MAKSPLLSEAGRFVKAVKVLLAFFDFLSLQRLFTPWCFVEAVCVLGSGAPSHNLAACDFWCART